MGQNVSCVNPTLQELRSKSQYWKRESTDDVIRGVYQSQSLHRLLISYVDPTEGFFPYENLPDYADLQPKLHELSLEDPNEGFVEFIFKLFYDNPNIWVRDKMPDENDVDQLLDEGIKDVKVEHKRFSVVSQLPYPLDSNTIADKLMSLDPLILTSNPQQQIYIVVGTEVPSNLAAQTEVKTTDVVSKFAKSEPSPIPPPRHVGFKRKKVSAANDPAEINSVTLPRVTNKLATKSVTYDWVADKPVKIDSSPEQHPNDPNVPAMPVAERIKIFSAYSANLTPKPYVKPSARRNSTEIRPVEFTQALSVGPDNLSNENTNFVSAEPDKLILENFTSDKPMSPESKLKSILINSGEKQDNSEVLVDSSIATLERKRVKFDVVESQKKSEGHSKPKNIFDVQRSFTRQTPTSYQHAEVKVKVQSVPTTEVRKSESLEILPDFEPSEKEEKLTSGVQTKLILTSKNEEIYEISIQSDQPYTPGSLVSIMPKNSEERVAKFLEIYQISSNYHFRLNSTEIPTTFGDFIRGELDLSAPPPLEVMQLLCATVEVPYDLYREFMSESAYQHWIERRKPDIFVIITSLTESHAHLPPVEFWLAKWPRIRPRLFYITSVTTGVITFNLRAQKVGDRYGLASNYLLLQPHSVEFEVNSNANFSLPTSVDRPIVLIASGFGLTAVRWVLELAKMAGWDSRVSLIYNPPDSKSVLYASEVLEANSDGRVSELFIFYGDPVKCVAQLWNDTKVFPVVQRKLDNNASIFVSGPKGFCQDVRFWLAGSLGIEQLRQQRWYQEDSGAYQTRSE